MEKSVALYTRVQRVKVLDVFRENLRRIIFGIANQQGFGIGRGVLFLFAFVRVGWVFKVMSPILLVTPSSFNLNYNIAPEYNITICGSISIIAQN
jgi:hypothetical protein